MTAIAYKNGVLASDNFGVVGEEATYLFEYEKIRKSKCERMAYGFSGTYLSEDKVNKLESLLTKAILESKIDPDSQVVFSCELKELIGNRSYIIVTSDAVYTRPERYEKVKGPSTLLPGEFVGIGSGRIALTVAMVKGFDARKAVKFAMAEDDYTYPGEVLSINQSELIPFQVIAEEGDES